MRRPFAHVTEHFNIYLRSDGTDSHFTVAELACKCGCGARDMDQRTIDVLDRIRDHFGVPVRPISGVRCLKHNKHVDGKIASQHLPRDFDGKIAEFGAGRAADIVVNGKTPAQVYAALDRVAEKLGIVGLGKYPGFTHIDTRDGRKARWVG